MFQLSHIASYPVDGRALLEESGTFWSEFAQDSDTIKAILEILAWIEADQFADCVQIRSRWSLAQSGDYSYRTRFEGEVNVSTGQGRRQFSLPNRMVFAAAVTIGDALLSFGQDFWIRNGVLITQAPLAEGRQRAIFYNTHWLSGDLSRFWSDIANIADQTDNIAPLIKAFFHAIQRPANEQTFKKLIAAVFDCPIPSQQQVVERVYEAEGHPIIIGSKEHFVGPLGSLAIVNEGQSLAPDQDIFDAVRYWDATTPPPSWVSALKIYPRYFAPVVNEPLEFSNTSQSVIVVNDTKPRITFPITGSATAVSQFFEFIRQREEVLGVTLAEVISGVRNPTPSQIPSSIVPLALLQKLWLSHGATVSFIRLEPTIDLLSRAQLLRRATPPWQTHILHFEQPVPMAMSSLC